MPNRIITPHTRQSNFAARETDQSSTAQRCGRGHQWSLLSALLGLLTLLPGMAQAQSAMDGFDPRANQTVQALALQADGKIVLGGLFSQLGGQPRSHIGRVNLDGTLDTSFNPGANDQVRALTVQADGKILVGGDFTQLGGQTRNRIGRLNIDGTLDTIFDPGASGGPTPGSVFALALQADGKILVGGSFTQLGGQARNSIGRLNADGTLDTTFNPGASRIVVTFALQSDGKIVVGGFFNQLGGQPRQNIGRLNSDGTLDPTFNPVASLETFSGSVSTVALQPDGKILVGGNFTQLDGQTRHGIGRLNADGTLDAIFNPGAINTTVSDLAVQADGKIMVGGFFRQLGGQPPGGISRLNPDGTFDTTFNLREGGPVAALAVQPDGKVVVGGPFSQMGGQTRNGIARLNIDGTLDATLNPGATGMVVTLAVQPDGKIRSAASLHISTGSRALTSVGLTPMVRSILHSIRGQTALSQT